MERKLLQLTEAVSQIALHLSTTTPLQLTTTAVAQLSEINLLCDFLIILTLTEEFPEKHHTL